MKTKLSKAYLLTKVLTASGQEVVTYLYGGAASYLNRSVQALEAGQRGEAAELIQRAICIVIELSGGLNYNAGGTLALRLDAIYNHLIESLTLAAARGDAEAVKACSGVLMILHDAWDQAAQMEQHAAPRLDRALEISA